MILKGCAVHALRKSIAAAAGALLLATAGLASAQTSTEWGWPQPYESVSDKSVQWLKDKGWWPLSVAFQPPWSGQNTINIVMDRQGLLEKRGVERSGRLSVRPGDQRGHGLGALPGGQRRQLPVHVAHRQEDPGQGDRRS